MWDFESDTEPEDWGRVAAPVTETLFDVADTAAGPCAVGDRGLILGRGEDGWRVVDSDGPRGQSRRLRTVAATDDGMRVWFAGEAGALGFYDLETGTHRDYTEPRDSTNTIHGLAVSGERTNEKLLVADASGATVPGFMRNDSIVWRSDVRVEGSTFRALTADHVGNGFGVDTEGNVWETDDDEFSRIGIEESSESLNDIDADQNLIVGGGNGWVFESHQAEWFPTKVCDSAITAVATTPSVSLAGGAEGKLYYKDEGDWIEIEWDGTKQIYGVAAEAGVAVGTGGTILERGASCDGEFWAKNPDDEYSTACTDSSDADRDSFTTP